MAFLVLADISFLLTTVSLPCEKAAAGLQFEHGWLMDGEGRPSRDAIVIERATECGSLLLLGGCKARHKRFGLALIVEVLIQKLPDAARCADQLGRQRLLPAD